MFTKSTPSAPYFFHSGMPGRNTCGANSNAASVIAAGSVTSEPSSGTSARQSQTVATGAATGAADASRATARRKATSTGRDAAITMITKTKSGSVYWRDSTYVMADP